MRSLRIDTKSRLSIVLTASGMEINRSVWRGLFRSRQESREYVAWNDVKRVRAFKKDCFAVDSMRMIFESQTGKWYEVQEEMAGWQQLIETLPKYLPGALNMGEWWQRVA